MSSKVELEPGGFADTTTGTTTDDYATALTWFCLGYGEKTILVENTGDTNTLTLKAFVRTYPDGIDYPEIIYYDGDTAMYERDLEPVEMQRLRFNNSYAELVVQVKSKVAESETTYQVDYAGTVTG